jgi:hypothetical protein
MTITAMVVPLMELGCGLKIPLTVQKMNTHMFKGEKDTAHPVYGS